eukprot:8731722-Alexandrium_andersonii.AAC.1
MKHTALQRICDISEFMVRKEKKEKRLSAAETAKLYNERLTTAHGTDPINIGFVDRAVTISRRMLAVPSIR